MLRITQLTVLICLSAAADLADPSHLDLDPFLRLIPPAWMFADPGRRNAFTQHVAHLHKLSQILTVFSSASSLSSTGRTLLKVLVGDSLGG